MRSEPANRKGRSARPSEELFGCGVDVPYVYELLSPLGSQQRQRARRRVGANGRQRGKENPRGRNSRVSSVNWSGQKGCTERLNCFANLDLLLLADIGPCRLTNGRRRVGAPNEPQLLIIVRGLNHLR